jgi:hypothetical protein
MAPPDLGRALCGPVILHPGDQMLWDTIHPQHSIWPATDRQRIAIAGTTLEVIPTLFVGLMGLLPEFATENRPCGLLP